ncbi:DUF86 domain-containing protein [Thermoactinomyces mirandus]|uniref:DUF86 domain-containing protein n=1 Tax=Thermoactinomyces mirandus TaxID=2756294 RepID=A0A7W2ASR9_9BACL|nr:DUF86 domain-containing protein [Thermoactinomyces mirandus]MBA4602766.1 DUF86 domain-containing protein [Thermoactinomyces mirandus]
MVYDVDVKRIQKQLHHLEQCAEVLKKLEGKSSGLEVRFSLERALHLAVECMIDVGTVMIDGFIMRDPGGYLDIVDILMDERVIDESTGERLKKHVRLRERLIRYYTEVDWEEICSYLTDRDLYERFQSQVRDYLKKELGEKIL